MRDALVLVVSLSLISGCKLKLGTQSPRLADPTPRTLNITVLTQQCVGQTGFVSPPLMAADSFRATLTGSELGQPLEAQFRPGETGTLAATPQDHLQLRVVGYSNGQVVSVGGTIPFSVVAGGQSGPMEIAVFIRPVNLFSGVSSKSSTQCAELTQPRAGHTATLLADGRVLFAGGFSAGSHMGNSAAAWADERNLQFRDDAEIFDPSTGLVVAAAPMRFNGLATPRAFHTATAVGDGVLVIGGESLSANGSTVVDQSTAEFYDPSSDSWSGTAGVGRSRHHAETDGVRVLIMGGITHGEKGVELAQEVTWYEPATSRFLSAPSPFSFASSDFSFSTLYNGNAFMAVGGESLSGEWTVPDVSVFQFTILPDGGTAVLAKSISELNLGSNAGHLPRHGLASATFGVQQDHVLVGGGFTSLTGGPDGGPGDAEATTEVASLEVGTDSNSKFDVPPLTGARGDLCAAALADGRVLFAGGFDGARTSTKAEIYAVDASGRTVTQVATPTLIQSRRHHTCTVLSDGSVLVAGGLRVENGVYQVLNSIEVFSPMP